MTLSYEEKDYCVGLDIGTTKICAVIGKVNEFEKLEVMGIGKSVSEGVKEGTVRNIKKTIACIERAIREAAIQAKVTPEVVNVGIAGKHIRSSEHRGSITRESIDEEISQQDINRLSDDMYRIIMEPGTQIIHVMPQSYTIDNEDNIKEPVGMSGIKLEGIFNIITAQTGSIRNIKKCVERSNLAIEDLVLEPLASSLSVLSEEEKNAGVVLVDIGGGTTDIAIFYENVLKHTCVLPFGGNIITSDIKQGCNIFQNQAESLKIKYGNCLANQLSTEAHISIESLRDRPMKTIYLKNLAMIIQARMEEIVEMVMSEIESSNYRNKLTAGLVITGGGAQLKNIEKLVRLKTGLDVRIGYPSEYLGKSIQENINHPRYATAIGLVLAGLAKTKDDKQKKIESNTIKKNDNELGSETEEEDTSQNKPAMNSFVRELIDKTRKIFLDNYETNDVD